MRLITSGWFLAACGGVGSLEESCALELEAAEAAEAAAKLEELEEEEDLDCCGGRGGGGGSDGDGGDGGGFILHFLPPVLINIFWEVPSLRVATM